MMQKLDDQPFYDPALGLSMAAGRADIYESMLSDALGYWEPDGDFEPLLDLATYRRNPTSLGELAHRGAGACRVCGMLRLADHLSAVSKACDKGDLDAAESLGARLPQVLLITRDRIVSHLVL